MVTSLNHQGIWKNERQKAYRCLFNISDLRRTTLLLIVTLFPRFDDCECLSDGESGGKEPVGVKKTAALSKNRWV
ncbi:hypothetical protein L484_022545 [Morus notabilis]|uniref:Uncharacterized protein n=1 Tax=Morus notabilis TaxID=981085 RepID=W9R2K2_9ROSA|nr:hypothetical protein L484_022545 [Morus notabilis]